MPRAVRYALVTVGITTMAVTQSAPISLAALSPPGAVSPVASIRPAAGELVGVGAPVTITFARPVTERAAAERMLNITSPQISSGRLDWINDEVLQWSPAAPWPAHSHVTVLADGYKTDFNTGAATVGVADISAHTFTVSIDGQVARQMPASMGKPSRPTPVGNFSVLEKDRTVVMDSRTIGIPLSSPEGYLITASYAERITGSGVYVHSAPWSVDSQGNANVSHGCINLSPDNAAWYYNTANVGDQVIVKP
jgi:lipoprotein-anchoring transpeptidase ErfK/SrfK